MGLFKKTQAIETTAEVIAKQIAEAFSSAEFARWFGGQALSTGWTHNDALAAWYSLGNLALVIAAWQVFNREPKMAIRTVDLVRSELLKQWKMPDQVSAKLRAACAETEEDALKSFAACENGLELHNFFSRYVSRILGAPTPFSNRSSFEDDLMGIENRGTDPIQNAALSGVFVDLLTTIKKLLVSAAG